MLKVGEDNVAQRSQPSYYDGLECFSAYSKRIQNLRTAYLTCTNVLGIFLINRHTLAKSSRCDGAFTEVLTLSPGRTSFHPLKPVNGENNQRHTLAKPPSPAAWVDGWAGNTFTCINLSTDKNSHNAYYTSLRTPV